MPKIAKVESCIVTMHKLEVSAKDKRPYLSVLLEGEAFAIFYLDGSADTPTDILPRVQKKIICEWIVAHQEELQEVWEKIQKGEPNPGWVGWP